MTAPSFETIALDISEGIAVVRLDRPEQRNAFNSLMMAELIAAFDHTDADDAVKVVVVTGEGRFFCPGAELAGASAFDRSTGATDPHRESGKVGDIYRDRGGRVALRIFDSRKPVIAAINGSAAGVGVTMTLPMDIRMASDEAKFGFVFTRRGIVPEAASSWFLPRLVGVQTALLWCYAGKVVTAAEALDAGLLHSVHSSEALLPAALDVAREIARNSAPVAVALTRQMMWRMLGAAHPMDAHRADSRAVQALGASSDSREGVAAFLEKREPAYADAVSRDLPDIWPGRDDPDFS